jgi:hypothetical protein
VPLVRTDVSEEHIAYLIVLKMEAICYSETPVETRATRCNYPGRQRSLALHITSKGGKSEFVMFTHRHENKMGIKKCQVASTSAIIGVAIANLSPPGAVLLTVIFV